MSMARLRLRIGREVISFGLLAGAAVWLGVIATGLGLLWQYEATPGRDAGLARTWPRESQLKIGGNRPTLLVFAHPKCPCTRATLAELSRVTARTRDQMDVHVVFVRPPGVPAGWERSDLWRDAQTIPGATLHVDEGAYEARRFGVATSGYALLYGAEGRLLFAGGITGARGHAGDNPGEDALLAALGSGETAQERMPAFGCSLLGET